MRLKASSPTLGCQQDDEQVGDVLGDFGRGAEVK
jgi:hypothetical protein